MPGSFSQVAPGRIQVRDGGGCLGLFGLPFFCAGILLTLVAAGVIPLTNTHELSGLAWPVLLLMGLVFTAVGGTLVFGRSWTTIDSSQRLVLKERGLLVPMHTQTYRLDDYTAVTLGFKQGDSDTSDQFPVSLKSRSGADLLLTSSTQYGDAWARAADVARHLHFDIKDATTDHPVHIAAGQADVPLQHRLRLDHAREEKVPRPPAARSEVREENGVVRIVIPMRRVHPVMLALMLVPITVLAMFVSALLQFFRQTHTPEPVSWFFLGFLILIFGILPTSSALAAFMRSRFGRTTVTVSSAGLRIDQRGAWRTKTLAALDAADIIDVDYSATRAEAGSEPVGRVVVALVNNLVGNGGITVKTRRGLTTFADGLAHDEIRYLHSVVRQSLAK